ncbi:UDP-N-acetylglucosamine 2-epimerase (non-hydrolyzing) [Dysgonomonas sp. Marseille-P4677]|uniref:non-hydrolyzing UDP-N-acetylglucosamine 2-epimerase n=1 Tax=Dysgonomonas sp. Marseille-P4677 TaxID=2364790 RepID=UPI001912CF93|nr:UDP-N-acetylglucosamine 2-epimerase (non-hydrolyzing) [Dysgonomonas sp. Marseille-P4677]MBK5719444.1 UDP-N-acetylglucosamine 2-epimerase (non-hydrolyzing) [Dysgonomonas sp. Marseille-P4677]
MKKVLLIFGTRPEAIKMAPLVKEFKKYTGVFDAKVCVTAQHRQMLDQVLNFFDIKPDYDMNLMRPGQNLYQLTADVIIGLKPILEEYNPDYVFVHGDTTTSTSAALAAYYAGAKICHVEAGLRTYNKYAPFPEEINRQITGRLADIHFSPTETAKNNLLSEGITKNVYITGNTVIDALLYATNRLKSYSDEEIGNLQKSIDFTKQVILVTGHRRENFGNGFLNICKALRDLSEKYANVEIVYPVHLNPNVSNLVHSLLGNIDNIKLINPLAYPAFVWLMNKSHIILTDSGGVQEEAPSLGKPVLVMRDTTERPEAVSAGTVKLVGTDKQKIVSELSRLLDDVDYYKTMQKAHNPYGNGNAVERIVNYIK